MWGWKEQWVRIKEVTNQLLGPFTEGELATLDQMFEENMGNDLLPWYEDESITQFGTSTNFKCSWHEVDDLFTKEWTLVSLEPQDYDRDDTELTDYPMTGNIMLLNYENREKFRHIITWNSDTLEGLCLFKGTVNNRFMLTRMHGGIINFGRDGTAAIEMAPPSETTVLLNRVIRRQGAD